MDKNVESYRVVNKVDAGLVIQRRLLGLAVAGRDKPRSGDPASCFAIRRDRSKPRSGDPASCFAIRRDRSKPRSGDPASSFAVHRDQSEPRSGGICIARGVSPGSLGGKKGKAPEGRQMCRRDARTTKTRGGIVVQASGLHSVGCLLLSMTQQVSMEPKWPTTRS
jgi:hypothetical protein